MNWSTIWEKVRPVASRLLAVPIAAVITWLTAKYSIELDATTRAEYTKQIVDAVLQIVTEFTTIYFATHRLGSVFLNPTDAASPKVAKSASAPMGQGERTRLGEHMQEVAAPNQSDAREAERARVRKVITPTPPEPVVVTDEPAKPPRKRAPRKKKEPSDVVQLRRSTDVEDPPGLGFAPPKDNPHSERGDDD